MDKTPKHYHTFSQFISTKENSGKNNAVKKDKVFPRSKIDSMNPAGYRQLRNSQPKRDMPIIYRAKPAHEIKTRSQSQPQLQKEQSLPKIDQLPSVSAFPSKQSLLVRTSNSSTGQIEESRHPPRDSVNQNHIILTPKTEIQINRTVEPASKKVSTVSSKVIQSLYKSSIPKTDTATRRSTEQPTRKSTGWSSADDQGLKTTTATGITGDSSYFTTEFSSSEDDIDEAITEKTDGRSKLTAKSGGNEKERDESLAIPTTELTRENSQRKPRRKPRKQKRHHHAHHHDNDTDIDKDDSIYRAPTVFFKYEKDTDTDSDEEDRRSDERQEYASHPSEFTKDGTPMPFWMYEMKKGTEYIFKLHRRYGRRRRHERVPVYKADLEVISVQSAAVDEGSVATSDMLHESLKYLVPLDRCFLHHRIIIYDTVFYCCRKIVNDYRVLNTHGHFIYKVKEVKGCLKISHYLFLDHLGNEVLKIEPLFMPRGGRRRYAIFCPLENLIGFVVQRWTHCCAKPRFTILDENGTEIIKFERIAPKFKVRKNPDLIFEYQSVRGQGPLGILTTKLADLKMANFTENDNYGMKMKEILPPNIKVRIMAAWFIIYGLFYMGRTYLEVEHVLTPAARAIYMDKKPSNIEIPKPTEGGFEAGVDSDSESM